MKPNPNKVTAFVLLGLVAIVLVVFAIRARTSDAMIGTWKNAGSSIFGQPQTETLTLKSDDTGTLTRVSTEPNGEPVNLLDIFSWHKDNSEIVLIFTPASTEPANAPPPTVIFKYRISDDGKMLWLTEGDQVAKVFTK